MQVARVQGDYWYLENKAGIVYISTESRIPRSNRLQVLSRPGPPPQPSDSHVAGGFRGLGSDESSSDPCWPSPLSPGTGRGCLFAQGGRHVDSSENLVTGLCGLARSCFAACVV